MNKPTIDQLKSLLCEITGQAEEMMQLDARFKEDLTMDSIAMADLIASLEEDFEIIIEQEQAVSIQTLAQLVDFIEKL